MPRPIGKPRPKAKKGTLKRMLKTIFSFYPRLLPATLLCVVFSAVISSIPSLFLEQILSAIKGAVDNSLAWDAVAPTIIRLVLVLAGLYFVSLIASFTYNQLMAVITQGTLKKFRDKMFEKMQSLPIKFFDTR